MDEIPYLIFLIYWSSIFNSYSSSSFIASNLGEGGRPSFNPLMSLFRLAESADLPGEVLRIVLRAVPDFLELRFDKMEPAKSAATTACWGVRSALFSWSWSCSSPSFSSTCICFSWLLLVGESSLLSWSVSLDRSLIPLTILPSRLAASPAAMIRSLSSLESLRLSVSSYWWATFYYASPIINFLVLFCLFFYESFPLVFPDLLIPKTIEFSITLERVAISFSSNPCSALLFFYIYWIFSWPPLSSSLYMISFFRLFSCYWPTLILFILTYYIWFSSLAFLFYRYKSSF